MLVAENEDSKILLSPGQGVKVKQWSSNVVKLTNADLGDFLVREMPGGWSLVVLRSTAISRRWPKS